MLATWVGYSSSWGNTLTALYKNYYMIIRSICKQLERAMGPFEIVPMKQVS